MTAQQVAGDDGLRTLPAAFEAVAARHPDAVAIGAEGTDLTYAELNGAANRLARHLVGQGVGPEEFVALTLPRGADMVVAILAVLKAGAAYVPIDPGLPADRIAYLIQDARPACTITAETFADLDGHPDHDLTDADRAAPLAAGHPAYVIYTSGSTGRPKGVVVSHANVIRLMTTAEPLFGFGPGDVWTLFHSFAFDFSVWELWGALLYGGRLVVVPYLTSRSPEDFLRLLARERVTVLNQTPSAFYALMDAGGDDPVPLALRYVIFGGEALDLGRLDAWFAGHPGLLVNMYGITETTVHVTHLPLDRAGAAAARAGAIGSALPDLRVHVLDDELRPAGQGEMYVAGPGLARGYLNRPALTAERFIADPYGPAGSRMYRSGDLARHHDDGTLDYQGRADQQAKIRGFRIEPGEIEAVLARHPSVAGVTVLAREDQPGVRRLVAYAVPRTGSPLMEAELRAFAAAQLPDYMVPAAVVPLEALPLTPNGKIDRAALPVPDRASLPAPDSSSRTREEELLAGIWGELLGRNDVGVHDNFFDLGGDSITGIQMVSRARLAGLTLTSAQVFEHQTVAELARAAAGPREAPVPAFLRLLSPYGLAEPGRQVQTRLLRLRRPVAEETLRAALTALVEHHEGLRLRLTGPDATAMTCVPPGGDPVLLAVAGSEAEACAAIDPVHGPLLRGLLIDGRSLLLAVHRIAVDPASWQILLDDLETACDQMERGQAVRLAPTSTSVLAWAGRTVSGFVPAEPVPGGGRHQVRTELSAERTARLPEVMAAHGVRMTEVVLTPLVSALRERAGGPVAIDVAGHDRDADVARTVGCLTTLRQVRADNLPADPGDALKQVKQLVRAASPTMRPAEVSLGYLGEDHPAGGLFQPVQSRTPAPAHPIEIECRLTGGRLELTWTHHDGVNAERLALRHAELLAALVDGCLQRPGTGYTPSDFPLAGLDQSALDLIQQRIGTPFGGRS
ncbi:amino acid adenylation domain-containing protein [Nonomuraea sp. NPDC005650]|uniref:amino acid adenylation domain-containing protein n=1 Tax=Nonomuraea sp. NPDC005650 TaxID=3157045 RepID=UPI0033BF972F